MPDMTSPAIERVEPEARAASKSPRQAAAWMQRRIDRDETAFRRRPGAADALRALRSASEALVHVVNGDRVDLVVGRKIGGFALAPARDIAGSIATAT
jgi:hypothetical protein